jgi:replication factor C subunit 3/5
MLWVDAHRPTSLERLDYHDNISDRLKRLATSEDLPHLLIYGPSGAGKKTRVMALLKELYGPSALKTRLEHKSFKHPNNTTKVEITTVASNYHIEMNPSDVGNNDRLVVQELIKEIAMYRLADTNSQKQFKCVVLVEVDQLSKHAQHALRRTMEKYSSSCRLILCCNSPSKVIDPLRSRCLGIRIGAPTLDEVHIYASSIKKYAARSSFALLDLPCLAQSLRKRKSDVLRRTGDGNCKKIRSQFTPRFAYA